MYINSLRNIIYGACPRTLRPYWDRVEASDIGSRMARGALWSIAGATVSRGLMLLASIFLARILGREVFGEFGMIQSTVTMMVVFAGFGLGMTGTKHVSEYRVVDPVKAGRIIGISGIFSMCTGVLMASGVFICSTWIAVEVINAPHLAGELRIVAFVLACYTINCAQTGALAGFEAFKAIARINFLVGITSFPILVCGAFWGGLRGSVWALLINIILHSLLNNFALRKEATHFGVPYTLKGCIKELPILWRFSFPAALSGLMYAPVLWLCNALLVKTAGYEQLGLFEAANQWRIVILFIPAMVGKIALPMLSSLNNLENKEKYRTVLNYNIVLNVLAAAIVAFPIIILAPFAMKLYGTGYEDGYLILIVLSVSSIFASINNIIGQGIVSSGKIWVGFIFNGIWAVILLLASAIFVYKGLGALGLAFANLIAYLAHTIVQYTYLKKTADSNR